MCRIMFRIAAWDKQRKLRLRSRLRIAIGMPWTWHAAVLFRRALRDHSSLFAVSRGSHPRYRRQPEKGEVGKSTYRRKEKRKAGGKKESKKRGKEKDREAGRKIPYPEHLLLDNHNHLFR